MNETPVRYDATTPRVDRRAFLKLGVAGGAGALVAACGWDGGNAIRPNLLAVSRLNDWVGEKILFSPTRLARTYSPAERSRSLPSYFISATTPMLKDPRLWRLRVDGLVDRPLELSIEDLMRMPRVAYTVKDHCVEGWSGGATWHGAAAGGKTGPRAEKAETPSMDAPGMRAPARRDSMLDPMRGGERVGGSDGGTRKLLKKKAARR